MSERGGRCRTRRRSGQPHSRMTSRFASRRAPCCEKAHAHAHNVREEARVGTRRDTDTVHCGTVGLTSAQKRRVCSFDHHLLPGYILSRGGKCHELICRWGGRRTKQHDGCLTLEDYIEVHTVVHIPCPFLRTAPKRHEPYLQKFRQPPVAAT